MSMGPNIQEEKEKIVFNRIQYTAKKVLNNYFENPIHYLFYGTLTLTILGLFFGMNFSWKLYGILVLLSLVKIYRYFEKNNVINIETKKTDA